MDVQDDAKVRSAIKKLKKASRAEAYNTFFLIAVGFAFGLLFTTLYFSGINKEPDNVMLAGDRVIVVIQQYGKTAYVFTKRKDHFEFETNIKPKSPYYPLPEREVEGRTIYSKNPKFNDWVSDWKKINKVD